MNLITYRLFSVGVLKVTDKKSRILILQLEVQIRIQVRIRNTAFLYPDWPVLQTSSWTRRWRTPRCWPRWCSSSSPMASRTDSSPSSCRPGQSCHFPPKSYYTGHPDPKDNAPWIPNRIQRVQLDYLHSSWIFVFESGILGIGSYVLRTHWQFQLFMHLWFILPHT